MGGWVARQMNPVVRFQKKEKPYLRQVQKAPEKRTLGGRTREEKEGARRHRPALARLVGYAAAPRDCSTQPHLASKGYEASPVAGGRCVLATTRASARPRAQGTGPGGCAMCDARCAMRDA